MNDKLCFVQFMHPGGEHGLDEPGFKHWNRGPHRRKFLRTMGTILAESNVARRGEVGFWGEWEPPSLVETIGSPVSNGPHYSHTPYLPEDPPSGWRQNTDPYVFGDAFRYAICMQHTLKGDTQLRRLARGSVVLFGSRVGGNQFALDTVLVVGDYEDRTAHGYADLRDRLPPTYVAVTLDPVFEGSLASDRVHRFYRGATYEDPVEDMFSFFPARFAEEALNGFSRPTLDLPEVVTPTMSQGKRLNPQRDLVRVRGLWEQVVQQVKAQGLQIGIRADEPRAPTWWATVDREGAALPRPGGSCSPPAESPPRARPRPSASC